MASVNDSNSQKERSGLENMDGMHTSGVDMNGAEDQHQTNGHKMNMMASAALSHSLAPDSPDNPQNWPLHRRILTSFQAWMYAFTV